MQLKHTPVFRTATQGEVEFCEELRHIARELGTLKGDVYHYEDERILIRWWNQEPSDHHCEGLNVCESLNVSVYKRPGSSHLGVEGLDPEHVLTISFDRRPEIVGTVEYFRRGLWTCYVTKNLFSKSIARVKEKEQEALRKLEEEKKAWEKYHYGDFDDRDLFPEYTSLSEDDFLQELADLDKMPWQRRKSPYR